MVKMAQQLDNSGRDPDLVSMLRTVCERAGLWFDVCCVPKGMSVGQYVDSVSNRQIPVPRGNSATGQFVVWVNKEDLTDEDRARMIAMGLPVPARPNDEVKS
jgi:hypothetical protein